MLVRKTYSGLIAGNKSKILHLENLLKYLQQSSEYVFSKGSSSWTYNGLKQIYHELRKIFPELNSKVLQNFLNKYKLIKGKKLPKHPIKPSILLDNQTFDFKLNDNNITNMWLKFHKKKFPVYGKYLLSKLNQPNCEIKFIEIQKKKNKFYIKFVVQFDISEVESCGEVVGLDTNMKRIVLSNNTFYSTKRLNHRKVEHYKNKKKLKGFTGDFLHKLTNQIAKDCSKEKPEVLVLENLRNLRKSASRKTGKSKGKKLNYLINSFPFSMFQSLLSYKLQSLGIKVVFINPAYTSKTCSRCGSQDTSRPKQSTFICNHCKYQLDADLNGSRNIASRYMQMQWATIESSPLPDPGKLVGNYTL